MANTVPDYSIVTAQGSFYAQLQWALTAGLNPAVPNTPPTATYSFMADNGKPEMYNLDTQQQEIGTAQVMALVASMRENAIPTSISGAIQYALSTQQQQLADGKAWVDSQPSAQTS